MHSEMLYTIQASMHQDLTFLLTIKKKIGCLSVIENNSPFQSNDDAKLISYLEASIFVNVNMFFLKKEGRTILVQVSFQILKSNIPES